jgi:CubicO group peptidase (beta-lactamase class C family)
MIRTAHADRNGYGATYLTVSLARNFSDPDIEYGMGPQSAQARLGTGSYGHGGGCGTRLTVNSERRLVFASVRNERGKGYEGRLADVLVCLNCGSATDRLYDVEFGY